MAGLTIENLTKSYHGVAVVDKVSFTVAPGEFCILLGPSGCGKSTILRLIAGLEEQEGGRIMIGDRDIGALNPRDRDVAMVFQSYALYPHLNVYENIAFPLRVRKTPAGEVDRRVREAAALLEIADLLPRRPREISGGQRQRVAIGRAIVRNPRLFLFDEPLSNLDAKLRAAMRVELAALHRRLRATTLYVTHDQVEAMTLGQKIVLMDRGVVRQIGAPRELYERPANLFAASFLGAPPINLFTGVVTGTGAARTVRLTDPPIDLGWEIDTVAAAGEMVTVGIRPEAVRIGTGPLRGVLEHLEHTGADTILYLRLGTARLIAREAADFSSPLGAALDLDFDPRSLHFFHKGQRV
ncbi:MAG: sn-glycerol-3-phosphate ABC transporter ATP-binding protein UgpC [Pseudomonadota bacterium]|nr:sn-glycerol-3-phosphate ABC transporter ATP-binding protein UgpC [Pseudomonadota bacterium]